jgi:hypothetical protein
MRGKNETVLETVLLVFVFSVSYILCLGQTGYPGSEVHDSAASVKESPDSTHHTDTAHFHYNYSGTGTLNNLSARPQYNEVTRTRSRNTLLAFGLSVQR